MDQALIDARTAYKTGKYKQALETYRLSLTENPENALAHQGVAQCLFRLGKLDAALFAAQKALEIDDNLAISHIILAVIYMKRNQYPEGELELTKSIELDPNISDAYINLGLISLHYGQAQDAIELFAKAFALDVNSWRAHFDMSIALKKQKKYVEALQEAKTAYLLHPSIKTRLYWGSLKISSRPRLNKLLLCLLILTPYVTRTLFTLPLIIIMVGILLYWSVTLLRYRKLIMALICITIIILIIAGYYFNIRYGIFHGTITWSSYEIQK